MILTASVEVDAPSEVIMSVVTDLETYPEWLDIVGNVRSAPPADGDLGPAWSVDLRAQLGPLRRSKRLRMVRSFEDARSVRFERRELDGRSHSPWRLSADLVLLSDAVSGGEVVPGGAAAPERTEVTMRLDYGGSLWLPMLDRLLAEEIRRARPRLKSVLESAR